MRFRLRPVVGAGALLWAGAAVADSSWMFFVGDGVGEGSLGLHWDLTQSGLCGQLNGLQYSSGGTWYTLQASVGSASLFGDPYGGCVLSAAAGAPVPPGLGGSFFPAAWLSDLPSGAFGLMGFQECSYAGGGTGCRDNWLIPQFGPLQDPIAWRAAGSSSSSGTPTSGDMQVVCSNTCTVTVQHDFVSASLLNIDAAGGAAIAGAVLAVWVIGWAVRQFIRLIRETDGVSSTLESE